MVVSFTNWNMTPPQKSLARVVSPLYGGLYWLTLNLYVIHLNNTKNYEQDMINTVRHQKIHQRLEVVIKNKFQNIL